MCMLLTNSVQPAPCLNVLYMCACGVKEVSPHILQQQTRDTLWITRQVLSQRALEYNRVLWCSRVWADMLPARKGSQMRVLCL